MALGGSQKDEFVTSLAALILYDGGADITSDNINTLLKSSNNTVAPYWPALFSGFLRDNIETLIFTPGAGAPSSGGGGAAVAADAGAAAPVKEAKPKVEDVDPLDGGVDIFGGGGGGGGDY